MTENDAIEARFKPQRGKFTHEIVDGFHRYTTMRFKPQRGKFTPIPNFAYNTLLKVSNPNGVNLHDRNRATSYS